MIELQWRKHEPLADYVALFTIAVFWAVFIALTFYDKPIIRGEALLYSYPQRTAAWEQIRGGSLPLMLVAIERVRTRPCQC